MSISHDIKDFDSFLILQLVVQLSKLALDSETQDRIRWIELAEILGYRGM
jgi:uncharacterized membrane protein YoaT (DUF817 family)